MQRLKSTIVLRKRGVSLCYPYFVAYGLAFDVRRTRKTKSGFEPAPVHRESGVELFGDLRLAGFASALRLGFIRYLVIVGRDDPRYKNVSQPVVIKKMLAKDYGVDPSRIFPVRTGDPTAGGTDQKMRVISEMMNNHVGDAESDFVLAVITNHYHIPRVLVDMNALNRSPGIWPAEALWLADSWSSRVREKRKRFLLKRFGGGPLAVRDVAEISGIAAKISGTYRRTARRRKK